MVGGGGVGWGLPHLVLGGGGATPSSLGWKGVPYPVSHPDLGMGYSSVLTWKWGTPHWQDGVPPPPTSVDRLKILPSLILSDVSDNKQEDSPPV